MHAQQEESARLLGDAKAEVRLLRKALDEAAAGKEALREKSALDSPPGSPAAQDAEERHLAQERTFFRSSIASEWPHDKPARAWAAAHQRHRVSPSRKHSIDP